MDMKRSKTQTVKRYSYIRIRIQPMGSRVHFMQHTFRRFYLSLLFLFLAGLPEESIIAQGASPEKIIATPETIRLLGNKVRNAVLLSCPYHRPFSLGNLQVELIPSGHMLGSAQMVVDKGDVLAVMQK